MQLHYEFLGAGKPVIIFIHGFLGSAAQWDTMVAFLKADFTVLLVELPGHGDSPEPKTPFSMDDVASAINDVMVLHVIENVHVVGHSMGGYVGAAFAKAYPLKTKSLTLINSIVGPDTAARKLLRDRAITLIDTYQDAYLSMAISNLFTNEERTRYKASIATMKVNAGKLTVNSIIQSLKAMRDRTGALKELNNAAFPIAFISGSQDTVIAEASILKEVMELAASHDSLAGGHMLLLTHASQVQEKLHIVN